MALLDELFGGAQTPWSKAMMEQMTGGRPSPMPTTNGRMGAGVAPPPRPEMEPTAQTAAPDLGSSGGIGGSEILGALLQGAGGIAGPLGRLVSQSGERERNEAQKNDTFKYFVKNGVPEETAAMAIRNPELGKHLLSKFLGPKTAPQIIKIPGQYGQETSMVLNPETGKLEPMSTIMSESANAAPPVAQGGVPQPVAMDTAQAPTQGPAAVLEAPGAAAPSLGTAPTQAPASVGDFKVGPAVPKPPDGYVHKASPDGRGFLWGADGGPVFESKAEAEARTKAKGEADASRLGEARVAEQFAGGLSQLKRLPDEFGPRAFERALGPWQASTPETEGVGSAIAAAVNWLPQQAARSNAELNAWAEGGAAPTEVRDRVETVTKNLAAVMKPLIRKPGEGAWSDKDQANLEMQIGALSRSRNIEEYNRRVDDIKENVSKVFLVNVPEPKVQERSPNAPKTAEEEVTAFDKLNRAINPAAWKYDGPIEDYMRGVPAKKGGK